MGTFTAMGCVISGIPMIGHRCVEVQILEASSGVLPMTMDTNFSKRDWIKELWDETEHDETLREFIFGEVLEDLEAHARDVSEAREDDLREELRDEIKQDLKNDPPDDLRARVIKDIIEYPPSGVDEAFDSWRQLEDQMRSRAREEVGDEMGDLKLTIETLQQEIADLKGVEYKPPRDPRKRVRR